MECHGFKSVTASSVACSLHFTCLIYFQLKLFCHLVASITNLLGHVLSVCLSVCLTVCLSVCLVVLFSFLSGCFLQAHAYQNGPVLYLFIHVCSYLKKCFALLRNTCNCRYSFMRVWKWMYSGIENWIEKSVTTPEHTPLNRSELEFDGGALSRSATTPHIIVIYTVGLV